MSSLKWQNEISAPSLANKVAIAAPKLEPPVINAFLFLIFHLINFNDLFQLSLIIKLLARRYLRAPYL